MGAWPARSVSASKVIVPLSCHQPGEYVREMVFFLPAPSEPDSGRTVICGVHVLFVCQPTGDGPRLVSVTLTERSHFLQPNVTCAGETRSQFTTGVGDGRGVAVGQGVAVA